MNRKFDYLGRIVIPKEMRDKIGLKNGDEASIELIDNRIVISNKNKSNGNLQERINKAIEWLEDKNKIIDIRRENYDYEYEHFIDEKELISILKGEE